MPRMEPYTKLFLNNVGNDLGSPYAGIQPIGDRTALDDISSSYFILRAQPASPATAMSFQ